jgi:antitoxin YefM
MAALLADDDTGAGRESPDDLEPCRAAFATTNAGPSELLVVAVDNVDVVGTLNSPSCRGLSRRGASRPQIGGVRIASGARGSGVGEILMTRTPAEARPRGCVFVQPQAESCRARAHHAPIHGRGPHERVGEPGKVTYTFTYLRRSAMKTMSYSESRKRYAEVLDSVVDDREEVVITRAGHEPAVIVSLDDYESLKEAAYLLRSPANARRLLASIDELETGRGDQRELLD